MADTPPADGASQSDDTPAQEEPVDEVAKWKAMARKHEAEAKRLRSAEAELTKLREATQSETEKAIEKARQEARNEATQETTAKANARIVRAEVKAAAGGKLADPNDAVRLLDLDQFEVDENGDVDSKAINKAIEDLGKEKPYLLANGQRPRGDADQGARGTPSAGAPSAGNDSFLVKAIRDRRQ